MEASTCKLDTFSKEEQTTGAPKVNTPYERHKDSDTNMINALQARGYVVFSLEEVEEHGPTYPDVFKRTIPVGESTYEATFKKRKREQSPTGPNITIEGMQTSFEPPASLGSVLGPIKFTDAMPSPDSDLSRQSKDDPRSILEYVRGKLNTRLGIRPKPVLRRNPSGGIYSSFDTPSGCKSLRLWPGMHLDKVNNVSTEKKVIEETGPLWVCLHNIHTKDRIVVLMSWDVTRCEECHMTRKQHKKILYLDVTASNKGLSVKQMIPTANGSKPNAPHSAAPAPSRPKRPRATLSLQTPNQSTSVSHTVPSKATGTNNIERIRRLAQDALDSDCLSFLYDENANVLAGLSPRDESICWKNIVVANQLCIRGHANEYDWDQGKPVPMEIWACWIGEQPDQGLYAARLPPNVMDHCKFLFDISEIEILSV